MLTTDRLRNQPPIATEVARSYIMCGVGSLPWDDISAREAEVLAAVGRPWRRRHRPVAIADAGVRRATEPRRSPRLAAVTAFVDARLAVHAGNTADAGQLVHNAFEEFPQPWYRAYANAAAAELAVLAELPDAAERLERARATARAGRAHRGGMRLGGRVRGRARGRLTGDRAAIRESVAIWARIGARFELECT